jgi:hypothetical protein
VNQSLAFSPTIIASKHLPHRHSVSWRQTSDMGLGPAIYVAYLCFLVLCGDLYCYDSSLHLEFIDWS